MARKEWAKRSKLVQIRVKSEALIHTYVEARGSDSSPIFLCDQQIASFVQRLLNRFELMVRIRLDAFHFFNIDVIPKAINGVSIRVAIDQTYSGGHSVFFGSKKPAQEELDPAVIFNASSEAPTITCRTDSNLACIGTATQDSYW